jgi:hypothetical protein
LNRDGGERLGLAFDLDAFLGFDGLVQAIAPPAAGHQAAGVFVDDDDLVVLDDVLDILLVKAVGLEQLGNAVDLLRLGLEFGLDPAFCSSRLRTSGSGPVSISWNNTVRSGSTKPPDPVDSGSPPFLGQIGIVRLSSMAKKSSSFSA